MSLHVFLTLNVDLRALLRNVGACGGNDRRREQVRQGISRNRWQELWQFRVARGQQVRCLHPGTQAAIAYTHSLPRTPSHPNLFAEWHISF